ncbi:hypothetical protein [Fructilactobacillus florum]|uniref:DUF7671 domain-containing protein n=1 Tax=Fructilactobacillus florum DSM 22689 = JCM 16035 TaxID=1423745 RepID=A0A0R2CW14_9LACO|nr:hypothetical protein [Fructilactobacillus florum]EKK20855.1 hypothetical protein B807_380 [Fructilactobacillus florum 2F]KRM92315.1 hypothetical protein FC87_GL000448 [Fructilactobacillus florum DSM 22689 = JCM 16035]
MGAKYHVLQFWGAPVFQDASGDYQLKLDQNQHCKLHQWRIGKHTKGTYRRPGQVFLTENHLAVVIVTASPLPFQQRHRLVPMARFLQTQVKDIVLETAHQQLVVQEDKRENDDQ